MLSQAGSGEGRILISGWRLYPCGAEGFQVLMLSLVLRVYTMTRMTTNAAMPMIHADSSLKSEKNVISYDLVSPFQIYSAPREASPKGSQYQVVTFFEFALPLPEA